MLQRRKFLGPLPPIAGRVRYPTRGQRAAVSGSENVRTKYRKAILCLTRGAEADGSIQRTEHVAERAGDRVGERLANGAGGECSRRVLIVQRVRDVEHFQADLRRNMSAAAAPGVSPTVKLIAPSNSRETLAPY